MNAIVSHEVETLLKEPGHELLKAALDYASRGWPVFPCVPGEKRPMTRHGVKDAATERDTIITWWTKWPDANVGLACGRRAGIYVVDCDTDKKTGEAVGEKAFLEACAAIGFDPETTLTARTPSGGRHIYFQHPEDGEPLKNSVRFLDGCDTRGEGGYVLVPPSRTAAGRSYYFENEDEPQPMPPALMKMLRNSRQKAPVTQPPAKTPRPRRSRGAQAYAEKIFQEESAKVAAAREGERNSTLNSSALRIFRVALAARVDLGALADDLHVAAMNAGLDGMETSRTIGSAMKAAREKGPAEIPEQKKPERRSASRQARPQRPPELDADAVEDLAQLEALVDAAEDGHTGPAGIFIEMFRDRYLFDTSNKRWYVFEDGCWKLDKLGNVFGDVEAVRNKFAWAADRYAKLGAEPTADKDTKDFCQANEDALRKARKQLTYTWNINAVVTEATRGEEKLVYDGTGWDKESHALPCANGVVDLRPENGRMGELRPGRPSDRFLKRSPIRFNAQAACPRFRRALAEIFCEEHLPEEDRAMCGFFRRLIGYSILRDPREQIFCFMTGRGSNGKSLIMELLDHVLGPLAGNVRKEVFLKVRDKDANAPSPSNFAFRGVGPCFCRELDGSLPFDVGLVKALSGNEPITARALYVADEVTFDSTHTLMIATNELPKLPAMDDATRRRVLVIPFKRAFKEHPDRERNELPKDMKLLATLKAEAEGILAWIVAGACEYMEKGLGVPDAVYAATNAYWDDVDDVAQFIDDCCHVGEGAWVGAKDLYDAYTAWCQESGIKGRMTRPKFKADMLNRGFERDDKSTRGVRKYLGIGLLTS